MKKRKHHIIIAEDDENITEIIKIILEDAGYSLSFAQTQTELLSRIADRLPDLVMLDIRLGGESGEDIARTLKSGEKTRDISLLLLSADTETEAIAQKVNADGFLLKPFDMDVLLATAKKYCE